MFDTNTPSKQVINYEEYKDKVLGCWTGKNIGGTLGMPFEGHREMNDATFYTQDLKGNPAPNDDLDLQLIWLIAAEEKGLYNLNERILGEYWLTHIVGPWNEYGVCKANIRNGLIPPLSGSCNNDKWKYSNGAWIRSEVWACIFPGSPDEVAAFAYIDSCCDHTGEGIYAEIFTAALESAAFIIGDVRKLVEIALSKIPKDSRIARVVNLVIGLYDKGVDFHSAREAVVSDSEDLGWFQAPANIGFVMIGLLYGGGDFGRSICLAANCGDDTDCTAGTVGAILGIIYGRSNIPQKWTEPIGENILTCSIQTYTHSHYMKAPQTLGELTERVIRQAIEAQRQNPTLPQIKSSQSTAVGEDYVQGLLSSSVVEKRVWSKSPYALKFDLPYGCFVADYVEGPYVQSGKIKKIKVKIEKFRYVEKVLSVRLLLPEGWSTTPSSSCIISAKYDRFSGIEMSFIPGEFKEAIYYLPVEIQLCDRFNPIVVHLPLQKEGSVNHNFTDPDQDFFDDANRRLSRMNIPIPIPS